MEEAVVACGKRRVINGIVLGTEIENVNCRGEQEGELERRSQRREGVGLRIERWEYADV